MRRFTHIYSAVVSVTWMLGLVSTPSEARDSAAVKSAAVQIATVTLDAKIGTLPVVDGKGIRFHKLSTADGLSQTRVAQIVQDDQGFLWFGTQYGLNRFDGYQFKVFAHDPERPGSLGGVYITALFKDRSGILWIGCDQFLDRFDVKTETFKHFRLDARDEDRERSSISIQNIYEDRLGMLWASTGKGLYRLEPKTGRVTHFTHDPTNPTSIGNNDVKLTGEVSAGSFWIGHSQGLDRLDPVTGRVNLHVKLGESGGSMEFHQDRYGLFWLNFGDDGKLGVFDPATRSVELYNRGEGPELQNRWNPVTSMLEDRDGTMWFGTGAEGLLKFDREHRRFIRFTTNQLDDESIPDDRVTSLFEDREGNVWVGLHQTGPTYFAKRPPLFESPARQAGQPLEKGLVSVIHEDHDKNIWLGTDGGSLRRIDRARGTASVFKPAEGVGVLAIAENASGVLWLGTAGKGLLRFDPKTKHTEVYRHSESPLSLSSDLVDKLLISREGTLWIATWDGLNRFDPADGTFRVFKPRFDYRGLNFHAIAEDDDSALWLGSNLGLYRFDPQSGAFQNFRHISQSVGSLSNDRVNSVFFDHSKTMWVGTQNGLDRFDRTRNEFTSYYQTVGLAGNVVSCILEDRHNTLWMGTNNGVSSLDEQRKQFRTYKVADGLAGPDLTGWGACAAGATGELFFGGFGGSVAFHPEQTFADTLVSKVTLTDFRLFGNSIEPGFASALQESITTSKSLTLPHWQNFFSLVFSALRVSDAQAVRYRYMLEGVDRSWVSASSNARLANYTGVSPGSYLFRVQAATGHGEWSDPGSELKIRVLSPWWSTWWFRSVCACFCALAAFFVHQFRLSQMTDRLNVRFEGRLAERSRIARDLHDTLLQSFHGLLLRLQSVQSLLPGRVVEAQNSLQIAIDRAADAVAESRNALYNLRSAGDQGRDLVQNLKALGQDLVASPVPQDGVKPAAAFRLLVEGSPRQLHALVQDEIYYIAREALVNAFCHAKATHIELDVRFDTRILRLRIRDDGIGIHRSVLAKNGKEGHWGLRGMRERAKGIGAKFEIWSELNQGTEIELTTPVTLAYTDSHAVESPPEA